MQSPGPIAFTIFGMDIRWYGILIAFGAMLAIWISCRRAPSKGMDPEDVLDTVIWVLPIGIVGARLYYVLFNWNMYRWRPIEVFNIRGGGLAIHGGLIFGIVTAYIICRRKKISFLQMLDLLLPTVALAQAIGRWGNFFNGEAHGTATELPWAILVDGEYVHPTFLYESIWCVIIFIVLSILSRRGRLMDGQIACLYGVMYSFERFFVESLRTDSLMIGPFRQAMVLSAMAFVGCAVVYGILGRNKKIEYKRSKK